jgi:hypothetical protein
MDTTSKFIKMCQTEEIQSGWRPGNGDFFFEQNGRNPLESYVSIWIHGSAWCYDAKGKYWLPRQDQLQDILSDAVAVGYLINGLDAFYDPERYCTHADEPCRKCQDIGSRRRLTYDTMEQWWVGFVMHERFNKFWCVETSEWCEVE